MKRIVAWSVAAAMLGYAGYGATQNTRSISAGDKRQGAQAHPQLLQEFGGAYAGAQANYVTTVGRRIAMQSGLSNSQSDFTITLLNSPVNNAFAIPGGYVYVTRQLLGLMNDEAELASVLGHEVGHVAARHSSKRNTTSTITQLLSLGLGIVTGSSELGQIAGQAGQLYTLSFSRQQEYQADDLGIRYLAGSGYDPTASASMLAALDAQSTLEARMRGQPERSVPSWASTHPNGADRVKRARAQALKSGVAAGKGVRNRDTFLAALDGALYDDDPAQGIVDGRTFKHPELRISFTAPAGYTLTNASDAVSITGSGGQAKFSGAASEPDLGSYVDAVFAGLTENGGVGHEDIRRTRVNGIETAYASGRANTGQSQVDVTVVAYQVSATATYHFVLITPAGQGTGAFSTMINSFNRLTQQQAAAIRPRRIDVVTVKAGDTVASLAGKMAYPDYRLERFLTLNALTAGTALRPGQKVKLVIYG